MSTLSEAEVRAAMVAHGHSLFARGYSCGTSGNLSVRLPQGGYLMSPTNVSLGGLEPEGLSRLDENGRHVDGLPPTKESWLHLAMYQGRQNDSAVVHLHSTYAVALSCRTDRDVEDALPALTPYVVMRAGRVAIVPYARPGNASQSREVARIASSCRSLLLANHGLAVAGASLDAAVAAAEELEETARLFFLLEGRPHRGLGPEHIDELRRVFGE